MVRFEDLKAVDSGFYDLLNKKSTMATKGFWVWVFSKTYSLFLIHVVLQNIMK